MTDAQKSQLAEHGYEVLVELHPRDLVRMEGDVAYPSGRLARDDDRLPEGTETLLNYRRNKWWARDPQGRTILICVDEL